MADTTPIPQPVAGSGLPADANPWTKGTTYPRGSVVRPSTSPGVAYSQLTNGDFESGMTGWTASGVGAPGWSITAADKYTGTQCAQLAAGYNAAYLSNVSAPTIEGQATSFYCYFNTNQSAGATVAMGLYFYAAVSESNPAQGALIKTVYGVLDEGKRGGGGIYPPGVTPPPPTWQAYKLVAAYAPANAKYVQAFVAVSNVSGAAPVMVDAAMWTYYAPLNAQQLFYAVQPVTGKSADTEPVWRDTTLGGGYIVDFEVQWSSTPPGTILWSADYAMRSGNVEPNWPNQAGMVVRDNGVDWLAVTPQVTDPNDGTLPPQSKFVFIASSKVFVLDGDIARYCATLNCMDWTAEADAGYLPIGLRAFGTNPFMAAGVYRSNAVFMNSEGLQMWQVDEDPANMALLDAIPVGCTRNRSIASVNDDMLFLSSQGVRSMGISVGSGNLQAGDVGMPVDPLVTAAMAWADANGVEPIGGYFPSLGQYFLAFPNWPGADPKGGSLFWSYGGAGATAGTAAITVNIPGVTAFPAPGIYFLLTFTNAAPAGGLTLNISGTGNRSLSGIANASITAGSKWMVTYDASNGRYFMTEITRVFVYTMSRTGEVGAWSHYLFQYQVESFVQAGDNLYMRGTRDGTPHVWMFDRDAVYDQLSFAPFTAGVNVESRGVVQWPWLDDGTPGVTKQMGGFDTGVTTAASFTVEIGYDQVNKTVFTTPHYLYGDTVTGQIVPIQVKAPSFSMRMVFDAAGGWSVQATTLYLTDKRVGS